MYKKYLKRPLDTFLAICGVIVLGIPMLIIGILVKLDSEGPVLFKQKRLGKNLQPFTVYKFRTMCNHAYEIGGLVKCSNDSRITNIGEKLRRTSLDELPQLVNVLKGDMSLIGNRPYLPREKEDMGQYFDAIVKTKPGLTGYWQVNGRSNTTFEERLKLEEYYSNHASLKMDIKILFKTVYVVLFHKGAE